MLYPSAESLPPAGTQASSRDHWQCGVTTMSTGERVVGAAVGGAIGGAVGSVFGPIGTVIGSKIGAAAGAAAADKLKG
jgi:hypothetical protein